MIYAYNGELPIDLKECSQVLEDMGLTIKEQLYEWYPSMSTWQHLTPMRTKIGQDASLILLKTGGAAPCPLFEELALQAKKGGVLVDAYDVVTLMCGSLVQ